jgi:hypothetical protein
MRFEIQMRDYALHPKEAQSNLIDIYTVNPSLFFGAAFRWITRPNSVDNPGARYLAKMTIEEGYLVPLLADPKALPFEEALLLAESMVHASPGLDCTLLAKFLEKDTSKEVPAGFFRVLEIVARMDQIGRTNSHLVQFLRSRNPRVRSKVIELLVRTTRNTETAVALLNDADERVRANAIEGLWPMASSRHAQQIFRMNMGSPAPRVAINSLIGLYKGGDPEAAQRISQCLRLANPLMQRAAAWAMGYLADRQFEMPLRKALRTASVATRGAFLRALVQINQTRRAAAFDDFADDPASSGAAQILQSGTAAWNAWRLRTNEAMPNLQGARLAKRSLAGADLSYCDLRGADLSEARLGLCSLFGADLRGTNLRGATLNRADLRAVEMNEDTCLEEATFHGAALYGVCFQGVKTAGAHFDAADLTATQLEGLSRNSLASNCTLAIADDPAA